MTPLSNYPRGDAPVTESFRVWRGDLVFGVVGLLDLIPGSIKIAGEVLTEKDETARLASMVVFVVLIALVVLLQLLTIFRKRWGMWVLLVLSVLGIGMAASDGFADARKDTWDAISLFLELVAVAYLPLRLFGKIGPPPR